MYNSFYKINIKEFLELRSLIGHEHKKLNNNMSSYIIGKNDNINVFHWEKLWKSYQFLFYNLSDMFLKRNTFLIVSTNIHLPITSIIQQWIKRFPLTKNKFSSFYISGFINKKWIGGLFSNWKVFYKYISDIKYFINNPNMKLKYKFQKYFPYLIGIISLKKKPIPDFIILLDKNFEALHEIKNLQIPLIGIIDTDINPNDYVYSFFGNNDSIENLEFFFEFLTEAAKIGRLKEQQLFTFYLLSKIQKKINGKNN